MKPSLYPTTPQVFHYTTLPCEMSDHALKAATQLINVDRAWHVAPSSPDLNLVSYAVLDVHQPTAYKC